MIFKDVKYIYYLDLSPTHFSSTEDFLCELSLLEPHIHVIFSGQPSDHIIDLLEHRGCRFSVMSLDYILKNIKLLPNLKVLLVGFTRVKLLNRIRLFYHNIHYVFVWHSSVYQDELIRKPLSSIKYRIKYLFVSNIISVSETAKYFLEKIGIPIKNAKVIYNGVLYNKETNKQFFLSSSDTEDTWKNISWENKSIIVLRKPNNKLVFTAKSQDSSINNTEIDISDERCFAELFPSGLAFDDTFIEDADANEQLKKLLIFKNINITAQLKHNKKNIMFAGSLERFKGFHVVLESVPLLTDFNILVAGQGSLLSDLQETAKKYTNLFYLGEVSSLSEIYRYCDYVLIPSVWHESFCLVGVEAQQYGVHVIASQRGALVEVLEPQKTTYLEDITAEAIVEAVQHTQKYAKKGESESKFSSKTQALEYHNLLLGFDTQKGKAI